MPDKTPSESDSPSHVGNAPKGTSPVIDLVKNAEEGLATILAFVESAKAAAGAAEESQALTATALSDAQAKLAAISTVATQATEVKTQIEQSQITILESAKTAAAATAEAQGLAATALSDAQVKLAAISTAATQAAEVKTQIEQSQTTILESAKAAAAAAAESQGLAATAVSDTQAKLSEVSNAATQAAAATTKITDVQAVIASKSDHIQDAQVHADKVRADLDRALTAATQQVTAAEAGKSNAQTAAENAAKLLTDIQASKGAVEVEAATAAASRKAAEESATVTKALADKSAIVETRIADYENRLAELDKQSADLLKRSEKILLGSTAVGLAHAFDARRQTFLKPRGYWQLVFVCSVVLIVVLAGNGLWQVYHATTAPTYDELVRMWLSRLPVAAALVWLALHASHESALAKRLEEDYAYKSAIATCFEGFRKQMFDIGKDADGNSALAKLCGDTLTTIATPPGRIYDMHKLTVTPIDELKQLVKAASEAAKISTEASKATVEAAKPVLDAAAKAVKTAIIGT